MACFAELVLARERGKAIFPVKVQPCEARGVFSDIQAIDLTVEPEEGYRRLPERSRNGDSIRRMCSIGIPNGPRIRASWPFRKRTRRSSSGVKTLKTLGARRCQGCEAATVHCPARVVLHRPEERAAEVLAVPRASRLVGDELCRPGMQWQVAELSALAVHLGDLRRGRRVCRSYLWGWEKG
jgi:hypothetical protein